MARRTLAVGEDRWTVYPSGRVTSYGSDEFGIVFERGTGAERERRFTRYSPLGNRHRDASLAEVSDRKLLELFYQSQPAWTAPEARHGGY